MKPVFLFLFFAVQVFSQTKLQGKIISNQGVLSGVMIVNRSQNINIQSVDGGLFEINANVNDVLVVTSPKIEAIELKLNVNSFKQIPLIIYVTVKPLELEEIEIKTISAKALGIIPQNQKSYTPAERRLLTANSGGPVGLVSNLISGKNKMLKKAVEDEKYQRNAKKLLHLLSYDFFEITLKINPVYIDGFLVLASENKEIVHLMTQNNLTILKQRLIEMAFAFKEMKNE
jgi:hypothetical protein